MLQALGISRKYRDITALDDVNLDVADGACVALVGESGAGKTTLLRMFNRLIEPHAGRVLVNSEDIAALDAVQLRRRIGYVPQTGGLLPHWSVLRNVALVPWLQGHGDPDAAARAALDLVGLAPDKFAGRKPSELSGGQRQRAAIARALAARPRYLLLDEAFGALDAITRADVQQAFLNVRRQLNVTTLLVTHDLREAALLADRIAVMRDGRIEQIDAPPTLFASPATPYVAELLGKSGLRA